MDEDGLGTYPSANGGHSMPTPSGAEEDPDDSFLGPVAMSFSHLTSDGYLPTMPGDPFSAITPSMWPQDIIQHLHREERRRIRRMEQMSSTSSAESAGDNHNSRSAAAVHHSAYSCSGGVYAKKVDWSNATAATERTGPQFDVFGFMLEDERGSTSSGPDPPLSPTGLSYTPFLESAVQRKRWQDYLQFHNSAYTCKICRQNAALPVIAGPADANLSETDPEALAQDKGRFGSQSSSSSASLCGCRLMRSPQLYELLTKEGGIPHAMRAQVWPRLCGAHEKRLQNATTTGSYSDILKLADQDQLATSRQIEKDLLRTLPSHACFATINSTGVPRLRRVLRCIAWLYPDIGYCQGMSTIAAHLLLFVEEEEAFWMMSCVIEDLLPPSYFSSNLLGVQADQRVLRELVSACLPRISQLLREHEIELSLICLHWFLTVFSSVVHVRLLLRIWDLFFYDGSIVLFQFTMGILRRKEEELLAADSSAEIFNCLSNAAQDILDIESLIEMSLEISESVNHGMIESQRRRHLAHLMADEGALLNPDTSLLNLPKQHVTKRQMKHSKSLLSQLWNAGGGSSSTLVNSRTSSDLSASGSLGHHSYSYHQGDAAELMKAKNIRQTEMLVDLRTAIMKIIKHFLAMDPSLQVANSSGSTSFNATSKTSHPVEGDDVEEMDEDEARFTHISITTDYSLESHARDLENYVHVARHRRRRAKALLDFERNDDDELGFRKNDIITVLSTKDDHCWVGEVNGLRGWFPAKFVELLDERSKYYSTAGDDTVNEAIADLVRGVLCPAIRAIFEHGLRRANLLDSTCHPWLFIEEAATKEVEKDFNSVYSRLVLCKTFRLEEDGKVLTPEELLYKAVQAINLSHDAYHAQMDVKFRSLICCGLNEQVLHLWLETLCSSMEVVKKWYQPWSFMRSPGWVQIKCELRLMAQFGFNLSRDFELPKSKLKDCERQRIRESIRDMLVRQHLFSWELN